jgi:hypothetical protein
METAEKQIAGDGRSASPEPAPGESELDSLLREYETTAPAATSGSADVGKVLNHLKPVVDYAKTSMDKDRQDAVDQDIAKAYEFMQETEELKGLKPTHIRGFMEAYALENPSFAKAFHERAQNPESWKAALESGRNWLKEEIGGMGKSNGSDLTDLEAAKAAVAGTTDSPPSQDTGPSPTEMFAMSDQKFKELMEQKIAEAG